MAPCEGEGGVTLIGYDWTYGLDEECGGGGGGGDDEM